MASGWGFMGNSLQWRHPLGLPRCAAFLSVICPYSSPPTDGEVWNAGHHSPYRSTVFPLHSAWVTIYLYFNSHPIHLEAAAVDAMILRVQCYLQYLSHCASPLRSGLITFNPCLRRLGHSKRQVEQVKQPRTYSQLNRILNSTQAQPQLLI